MLRFGVSRNAGAFTARLRSNSKRGHSAACSRTILRELCSKALKCRSAASTMALPSAKAKHAQALRKASLREYPHRDRVPDKAWWCKCVSAFRANKASLYGSEGYSARRSRLAAEFKAPKKGTAHMKLLDVNMSHHEYRSAATTRQRQQVGWRQFSSKVVARASSGMTTKGSTSMRTNTFSSMYACAASTSSADSSCPAECTPLLLSRIERAVSAPTSCRAS
mmetsp:Transcript_113216/g.365834  ORF Transcript_113216/g.365834 Transcript_113216/m.365834 type:complete len:222 (+) Transcript_113216:864-1529(+)